MAKATKLALKLPHHQRRALFAVNDMIMKPGEILTYAIVAISSLFIMGSVVHMMVGGLVSENTETTLIVIVCTIDAIAIGFMARDAYRRRKATAGQQRQVL
jgi:positive regulator of sigma E activity